MSHSHRIARLRFDLNTCSPYAESLASELKHDPGGWLAGVESVLDELADGLSSDLVIGQLRITLPSMSAQGFRQALPEVLARELHQALSAHLHRPPPPAAPEGSVFQRDAQGHLLLDPQSEPARWVDALQQAPSTSLTADERHLAEDALEHGFGGWLLNSLRSDPYRWLPQVARWCLQGSVVHSLMQVFEPATLQEMARLLVEGQPIMPWPDEASLPDRLFLAAVDYAQRHFAPAQSRPADAQGPHDAGEHMTAPAPWSTRVAELPASGRQAPRSWHYRLPVDDPLGRGLSRSSDGWADAKLESFRRTDQSSADLSGHSGKGAQAGGYPSSPTVPVPPQLSMNATQGVQPGRRPDPSLPSTHPASHPSSFPRKPNTPQSSQPAQPQNTPPQRQIPSPPLSPQPVALSHAGAVLLGSFLPQWFTQRGHVVDGQFIHQAAQLQALDELAWLLDVDLTQAQTPPSLLLLLCDLPLALEVEPREPIDEAVRTLWLEWLACALEPYQDLQRLGVPLFRQWFVQRQGTLLHDPFQTVVHVNANPTDVLLRQIDWDRTALRLPWLGQLISIEWEAWPL